MTEAATKTTWSHTGDSRYNLKSNEKKKRKSSVTKVHENHGHLCGSRVDPQYHLLEVDNTKLTRQPDIKVQ